MSKKYVVVIEPSDDEYYAYVPEIPGCVSGGSTIEETLENVKEAISLALEYVDQPPVNAHQHILVREIEI
jgi:predicted RNase H-like HicB family nuclease